MRVEIECINKIDRNDPYTRISYIGGVNPNSEPWKLSLDQAVRGARDGKWDFFVKNPYDGHIVEVEVAVSRYGNPYLKTEADQDTPDNLLKLPECP